MYTPNKTIFLNELKLMFFIALTGALIVFFGYLVTDFLGLGTTGIYATFFVAVAVNFVTYFFSKDIVLKSQHAVRMTREEFGEYYSMVEDMCERNNIKLPELYYINSSTLNAFATGRNQNNAAVVVTTGLLNKLPMDEISGVVGHELSHIVHKDIMVTSFITTLVGFISILASSLRMTSMYRSNTRRNNESSLLAIGIIASMLAPLVGTLIKMAVSRSREYMADATGAKFCGDPKLLANALYRISHNGSEMPMANEATAPLYIANPLRTDILTKLFSTHPDIDDRIKRLQEMDLSKEL